VMTLRSERSPQGQAVIGEVNDSWLESRSAPNATSDGLRILLAEDNAVNQRLAVRLLEKQGHVVTVAPNGREAIRCWRQQPFDLILMDVQMPEMGGLEATGLIRDEERSNSRHTPIIALTAHAIKGDRERCLAAGMDAYVSKPIQATELMSVIEEVRGGRPTPVPSVASTASSELFDEPIALERVAGDMGLLRELAELFLSEYQKWLTTIREAITANDAAKLRHSAHSLKGAVSTFASKLGYEAALKLEMMGKNSDLAQADAVRVELETVLSRLCPILGRIGHDP